MQHFADHEKNQDDVEKGMTAAREAGLSVFRTWGFNDKNATYDPNGLPQYGGEGAGDTEVVFQRWANGTSIINLAPFDKVVDAATNVGIKLIVALTNNWADYGGMDVYTTNLGGKYHDDVCWPLSLALCPLTLTSIVLPSPRNQEQVQTICQGNGHTLQKLSRYYGMGARQ